MVTSPIVFRATNLSCFLLISTVSIFLTIWLNFVVTRNYKPLGQRVGMLAELEPYDVALKFGQHLAATNDDTFADLLGGNTLIEAVDVDTHTYSLLAVESLRDVGPEEMKRALEQTEAKLSNYAHNLAGDKNSGIIVKPAAVYLIAGEHDQKNMEAVLDYRTLDFYKLRFPTVAYSSSGIWTVNYNGDIASLKKMHDIKPVKAAKRPPQIWNVAPIALN